MEKNFTIKGNQLACTLEGDPKAPSIILIHDLFSHREVWKQTITALKGKYYCIAIDLLGFGASDKPKDGDYSIAAQGERILLLANQLGIRDFSLIGHSMGGQIVFCIAAVMAPQRVKKLVCVAGLTTGAYSNRMEKVNFSLIRNGRKWPWLYEIAASWINFRPFVSFYFKPWFHNIDVFPFASWEIDRRAALNPACAISYDESQKSIHALDLTQHLRKIKVKTLLIHGKQDATVLLEQALLAQTLIPDNDLALIENCGHFPMYEKATQYLRALDLIFGS